MQDYVFYPVIEALQARILTIQSSDDDYSSTVAKVYQGVGLGLRDKMLDGDIYAYIFGAETLSPESQQGIFQQFNGIISIAFDVRTGNQETLQPILNLIEDFILCIKNDRTLGGACLDIITNTFSEIYKSLDSGFASFNSSLDVKMSIRE